MSLKAKNREAARDGSLIRHDDTFFGDPCQLLVLTWEQRERLGKALAQDQDKPEEERDHLFLHLIMRCLWDPETHGLAFDEEDLEYLKRREGAEIQRLGTRLAELNGFLDSDEDEEGNGSPLATDSDGSPPSTG